MMLQYSCFICTCAILCITFHTVIAQESSDASRVDVTLYSIKEDEFNKDVRDVFINEWGRAATEYCKNEPTCLVHANETLMAELSKAKQSKGNVKVEVGFASNRTGSINDKDLVKAILLAENGRLRVSNAISGSTWIVGVGDVVYGNKPDDPNNWIIIGVSCTLTLILLFITVYLVKHRVDHAAEHQELQKEVIELEENGAN